MAYKPITEDEILETLSDDERSEVLRDDFNFPLKLYLNGFNNMESVKRREAAINKLRLYARNRAAVRDAIIKNPDISKTPVDNPIVIIGLPRSGTTLLQRLLSSDAQFLTPMFWEMVISVPPGRPEKWEECERYKKALEIEDFKGFQAGAMDHIHKLRLELDAECLVILQQYFIDTVESLSVGCMNEWRNFIYNCSEGHITNLYEFHKMCLKCIFYGNLTSEKTLLLKASLHLLYLEAFRKEYPNAKFIYPYRNLKSVISSLASLQSLISQAFGGCDSTQSIGHMSMEYVQHCATRLVKVLKTLPEECHINIAYTDLVENPMATVKKIYSHFNLQLTPEAEEAMQRYLQENTQNKHGKHQYSLEQFGISDDDIKNNFAEYLEYFKNGNEKLV